MSTPVDHDAGEKVKPADHTIGGAETANQLTQIEKTVQTVQDEAPIHKLSEDLLMFVVEMVCLPANGGPVHGMRLGSVCRRFRDTTLRMPRLWSVIRFSTSVEWTALQLDRSGEARLKIISKHSNKQERVDIEHCAREGACAQFWKEIVKHHHRWETLYITSCHTSESLCAVLMNLELPCLERLTMDHHDEWNSIAEAVGSWIMPKLRHLTGAAFVCGARLTAPLESLRIFLPSFSKTSPFIKFLSSPACKTLRNLEVESFRTAYDQDFSILGPFEKYPHFELKELQYLRIEICSLAYEKHEAMYELAKRAHFDNLKKLELKFDISEERRTYNLWQNWLVETDQNWEDSLAEIDIFVRSDSRDYFNRSELSSLRYTSDVMKKQVPKLEKFRLTYLDEDENQVGNVIEL